MSIRIKKAMGYAGKHPNREALTEKLNEEHAGEVAALIAQALLSDPDDHSGLSLDSAELAVVYRWSYPKCFYEVCRYAEHPDDDDGLYIIQPPSQFKRWYRFDDIVDSYEAGPDLVTTVRWLDGAIYPYIEYMDAKTGEKIKGMPINIKMKHPNAVPMPPRSVRLIADQLGFDWKSLRPAIITWWS